MPASLFPFDVVRHEQDAMIKDVHAAVSGRGRLIAHAPTGMGKTAAVLAPSLAVALEKGLTVFFLTSRHTQHALAVDTLRTIKEKHGVSFSCVDIVGKKNMCAREEVEAFPNRYFHDYCRSLREDDNCEFYLNFRKEGVLSASSKNVLRFLSSLPAHTEEMVGVAKQQRVCPYEVAALATKKAAVVIADYNYIFNSKIRESLFKRNGKSLEECIIIVDEAHNLPSRMRDMLTERLSTLVLERAVKEAGKFGEQSITEFLARLQHGLKRLATAPERIISREELLAPVNNYDMPAVLKTMFHAAELVREAESQSFIGSAADFLASWMGDGEGFARILNVRESPRGKFVTASYHCLDPSAESKSVVEQAQAVVMMSGTLTPMAMYRDILGFPEDTVLKEYGNPLPEKNRLALIDGNTTTRFSQRSPSQFMKIAQICAEAAGSIPGNVAIFFPSYHLMEQIHAYLHEHLTKKVFKEHQDISKAAKQQLLREFRQASLEGGVLLAVIGGNFSEGIDLPGRFLNGVVIVGLPFAKPDLCTKELISYYDRRFGRGWDYGYVFPAFTKALQSAGRCIRTETDRGVLLFVDERYTWQRYYSCFPRDLSPKATASCKQAIQEFFSNEEN